MQVVSANVLPVHGYMTLVVTTIKHYINNVKQWNIRLIMANYYD